VDKITDNIVAVITEKENIDIESDSEIKPKYISTAEASKAIEVVQVNSKIKFII